MKINMYHANSGTTTDIILFFKWKKIDLKELVFCREKFEPWPKQGYEQGYDYRKIEKSLILNDLFIFL